MKKRTLGMLMVALCAAQADAAPADIVGDWRGTSLCTDRKVAPACKDEDISFVFTPIEGKTDAVHVDGRKLAQGQYVTMGEFDLTWVEAEGAWVTFFDTRGGQGKWSFRPSSGGLTGELIDMPTGAQVRKVSAKRWKP